MGMVSTITIGADTFSVYALTADPVADANSYFAARLGASTWTAATTLQKQQSLITAARMLDRRAIFTGTKTNPSQPLEWPRDNATSCGEAVPNGTVPDDIVLAEFELALALLINESIQASASTGSNIKSVRAGSAGVEFFLPTVGTSLATQFPQPVHELLHCYLVGFSTRVAPIVTGVDPNCCNQTSSFNDDCGGTGPGLVRGL